MPEDRTRTLDRTALDSVHDLTNDPGNSDAMVDPVLAGRGD